MKQENLEQQKIKFKYNLKTLGRLALVQALYSYLMQIHLKNLVLKQDYSPNKDIQSIKSLDIYNYEINGQILTVDAIYKNHFELNHEDKGLEDEDLDLDSEDEDLDLDLEEERLDSEYSEDEHSEEEHLDSENEYLDSDSENEYLNSDSKEKNQSNLNKKILTENNELVEYNKKIYLEAKVRNVNNYCAQSLYNHNMNILNVYNTTIDLLDQTVNIDTKHHKLLLENISNNFNALKNIVIENIIKDENNEIQIPHPLLMSILIAGTCEIIYFDLYFKIVINEFTNIANSLLINQEIKFVNSILDKISKKYNKHID